MPSFCNAVTAYIADWSFTIIAQKQSCSGGWRAWLAFPIISARRKSSSTQIYVFLKYRFFFQESGLEHVKLVSAVEDLENSG